MFDRMDVDSVDRPLRTFTASGADDFGLVQPFIVPFFSERTGQEPRTHSVDGPLSTVTSHRAGALVQPFIVPIDNRSNGDGTVSTDTPLGTITTKARFAVAEPFITKYYGTQNIAHPVSDPLDTVTTKDRFALVTPEINGARLDIRFRMLQPSELAAAMGFSPEYRFAGNREEQVRQIGNAVAVNTAAALCSSILRLEEVSEAA
jgi:DNA (cytosine-5)-methyltransferase 1